MIIRIYSLFHAGKLPVPITFSCGKARLLFISLHCYARTSGAAAHGRRFPTSADTPLTVRFTAIVSKFTSSFFYQTLPHLIYSLFHAGKLPVPITFSRGKARLLFISLHCYARTSGAAAHGRRFPTSADTPLAVRFTAILLKFSDLFFYQALPHLMQSLCCAAWIKFLVCNQSGTE